MRNVAGDQKHDVASDATAGAGGGKVGIAGSLALTIADIQTSALISSNAARGPPVLHNADVSLTAV